MHIIVAGLHALQFILLKKQEAIQESTSVSCGGKKKIIEPSPEVRINAPVAVHH